VPLQGEVDYIMNIAYCGSMKESGIQGGGCTRKSVEIYSSVIGGLMPHNTSISK
jgi:hypothetical protein